MKANISRWIILLLALVCAVQAASAAGFDVKTQTISDVKTQTSIPEGDTLEPGQEVKAHYVLTYSMFTSDDGSDETIKFRTELRDPSWRFTVFRDGIAIYTTEKPVLSEFDISYGEGNIELDAQVHGTVPTSTSETVLVTKIEHLQDTDVKKTYSVTRKVVSAEQVGSSLSVQQQNLKSLKADIDARAADGVDVSAAQAKYDAASKALTNAASAAPSKAAEYIASAIKNMDEAKPLLDKAWAEKEVSDTGAALESLDNKINYFVENRSMGGDPRVVSIVTKRESAVQFYSQAKDGLSASNYQLARSKAAEGLNKANEALSDADALRDEIGEGFSLGGNILLYVGIGVIVVLAIVGVVIYRKKTRWDELG
ncbi:hypothetical protein KH990_07320 [Methanoculleus bourgensis]|uniref:hypothetical protein n=1 Tax=Methanoculleus bourgensis TaxID=83986 RepID=UPI001BD9EB7F|nr:hypothetical protein [Methanoculleus bourgensis]MBT0733176.1 hypothetical protein [Methanoculleus bourgensis]